MQKAIWYLYREIQELEEEINMPRKPKIPCKYPDCQNLIEPEQKYCEAHKKCHPEILHSEFSRGYGWSWQKASKRFLCSHPMYVSFFRNNRFVKIKVVGYIIPHQGDKDLF